MYLCWDFLSFFFFCAGIFIGKNISNTFLSIKDQEHALSYDLDILMNEINFVLLGLVIHKISTPAWYITRGIWHFATFH